MKSKKTLFAGILIGASCSLLVFTGQDVYSSYMNSDMSVADKTYTMMNLIDSVYVGDEYDNADLLDSMYHGLIDGLEDPYSTYMSQEEFADFMEQTEGTYYGIGASVRGDNPENQVEIVMPYEGAPAAEAGLVPGDRILAVDGEEVYGDDLDGAVSLIKGPEDTDVTLTVLHQDGTTEDVTVTRGAVDVPTVEYEMMEDNTGYIRITSFDRVTEEQYFEAYDALEEEGMEKLIIDLRDNPGGLLDVVVSITDSLVPEGTIVYTEDADGNKEYETSDADAIDIPLVVLVNENSASASEIMTAAVQDYGVGTIVGETTFGKGIVQNIYPLPDGSAVKLTMAKYYTPNGESIHGVGVEPDIVVEYDEYANGFSSTLDYEDDIQLQKAWEVVNE